jgi:hypothetical protein
MRQLSLPCLGAPPAPCSLSAARVRRVGPAHGQPSLARRCAQGAVWRFAAFEVTSSTSSSLSYGDGPRAGPLLLSSSSHYVSLGHVPARQEPYTRASTWASGAWYMWGVSQ